MPKPNLSDVPRKGLRDAFCLALCWYLAEDPAVPIVSNHFSWGTILDVLAVIFKPCDKPCFLDHIHDFFWTGGESNRLNMPAVLRVATALEICRRELGWE